ncbi:MAG: PEP-utilizing enzyme [bacterium]|nr:PEP-utilizing enzyme [bacterium]
MSIPQSIKNKIWVKNWSGNWSFLFASLYGDIYTKGLEDFAGMHIKDFVLIFENGVSSNFYNSKEIETICGVFANIIERDDKVINKWARFVIQQSGEILKFTARFTESEKVTEDEYGRLCGLCASFTPQNFAIKKVIDYLPVELFEKCLPIFSEARKATEPIYNEIDRVLKLTLRQYLGNVLSENELDVITKSEFDIYLKTKKLPDRKLLKVRYGGVGIVYDKVGLPIMVENEDFSLLMEQVSKSLDVSELKGQIAYKGMAKGKVKIVLDLSKVATFEEGDILVTGMTRPEFLPLMKKAGGFVTDAGGMLSHAAIVARELKKPCVVGTNIATKVLKDGDIVEINTNTGVVKIIK